MNVCMCLCELQPTLGKAPLYMCLTCWPLQGLVNAPLALAGLSRSYWHSAFLKAVNPTSSSRMLAA